MNLKPHLLILALVLMGGSLLLAQTEKKEKEAKKEKEYIIIRKQKGDENVKHIEIKDKDANVIIHGDKVIELKGNNVFIEEEKDLDGEMYFFNPEGTEDIKINVTGEDGTKHIVIEFTDENGAQQHLEWEGEGEVPPHIQKYLHQPRHTGTMEWFSADKELHEEHAFLGVSASVEEKITIESINGEETVVQSEANTTPGFLIDHVVAGSAAEEAGLQAEDIILKIDGQAIDNFNDLKEVIGAHKPGDEVSIEYQRGEQTRTTDATLKAGGESVAFEWDDEEENIFAPMDGENVFIFRSGDDFDQEHNVIIIKKIDSGEENAIEVEEILPELELERSLELKNFEAFPNPSSGQIQLNFEGNQLPITIQVTNLRGQQVYREYMRGFTGVYNQTLDLSDLSAGAYVLSIEQEGKIYAEQLIIK